MITAFDDTVLKSEGESRVDVWEGRGKVTTPPTDVLPREGRQRRSLARVAGVEPGRHRACVLRRSSTRYPAEIIIGELKDGKWTTEPMPQPDEGMQVRGYGSPLAWSERRHRLI